MGVSRTQFIEQSGMKLSERRLWQIEMSMPEPRMQIQKLDAIARALGYDRNGLERAWRSTPVTPPEDEGRSRAGGTQSIALWLSGEAKRLNLDRGETAERLVGLLEQLSESERDRMYEEASPPGKAASPAGHSMRIPRPGKDARLRPAAKSIPGKNK
jgi:hypothetical protein